MKNPTPNNSTSSTSERISESPQERDMSNYNAGYRQAKKDQIEKDNQRVAGLMIGSIIAVAMGLGAFTWYLFSERNQPLQPVFVPQEESSKENEPESRPVQPNINVTIESPDSESDVSESSSDAPTAPVPEPNVSNNAPAVNTEVNVESPSPNSNVAPSPAQNTSNSSGPSSATSSSSAEPQSSAGNSPSSEQSQSQP